MDWKKSLHFYIQGLKKLFFLIQGLKKTLNFAGNIQENDIGTVYSIIWTPKTSCMLQLTDFSVGETRSRLRPLMWRECDVVFKVLDKQSVSSSQTM